MQENSYHLIGIGGIGMSALARILLEKKAVVSGSDIHCSKIVESLQLSGAQITLGHAENNLPKNVIVVYSSAVRPGNPEILMAEKMHLPLLHRSKLLDRLMQGQKPLLVTGTHGKTTTTSLLATTLLESGKDPSFVIGGMLVDYQTNGRLGHGSYFVAEADESDGSFLQSKSFGAIVTNCEREHMDYWKDEQSLQKGFATFFSQVFSKEHLFWCKDDPILASLSPPGVSYGFSRGADCRIENFSQDGFSISFSLEFERRRFEQIRIPLTGKHNALNAAAVFGLSLRLGLAEEEILRAFGKFSGVCRRLQHKGRVDLVDFFDDYGHHPTEIRATLLALRAAVKERRIVLLFQPHRYSRTKDLFLEFGSAFTIADLFFITDLYEAGEKPEMGIDAKCLAGSMTKECIYLPKEKIEEIASFLKPHDVFITIGAGDVTSLGEKVLQAFAGQLRT